MVVPFKKSQHREPVPVKCPMGWFKCDLYCVIDFNNRTTITYNQCLA
ncbi:hypothetical protein P20311_3658 [Pseudoalteromonas sp. BSi20311]|nr:hypothetical protein P20311_3658 [Pseudoalteromonas sp. BSi20311]